jgi:hypothetical protein
LVSHIEEGTQVEGFEDRGQEDVGPRRQAATAEWKNCVTGSFSLLFLTKYG